MPQDREDPPTLNTTAVVLGLSLEDVDGLFPLEVNAVESSNKVRTVESSRS
jgi:hypothetical protein